MNFFVNRFSKLYGHSNLRFKLHLQLHLLKQVKDFGPLHRYSCFPFEGYFSIMKKFLHGTRGFVNQLHQSSAINLSISKIPDILSAKSETGDEQELNFILNAKEFYSRIKKNYFSFNMSEEDISSHHKTVIESFNFNIKSIRAYKRILCKNISKLYF